MNKNYIIDKSFQMLRTNISLTSNYKINVTTDMSLYLESINSVKELNDDKYKHFSISKESYLEDKLINFYDKLPSNIAFSVQDKDDKDIVYKNYSDQFDDLYWSGAKKVEQNKFYEEEFEYFAPLYLKYGDLPDNFIIMRIDRPGVYEANATDYNISNTTPENFRDEIINKWKLIESFDLTKKSELGKWMNNNFIENERFPKVPFEFDSNSTNFSRWYGIDYNSGTYTEKSQFLSDKIWYEQPHFKLEEYITEGYKRNEIIFPNILNMNFLFNDNPASPFQLNKYSINRYMGFYVDMEKIDVLTSYKQYELKTNLKIVNNIFMESTAISGSTSPFFDTDEEWDDNDKYFIYGIDNLFEVKRVKRDGGYSYNIISEYDLEISDLTRDKECVIDFIEGSNFEYKNVITMRYLPLILDRIITSNGVDDLYADLYLIKIDNKYHVIEYNEIDDEYLIRSDYGIRSDENTLKYWVENESKSEIVLTHDKFNNSKPIVFEIYRVQFRDIKDFDYNRIDSGFADFDFDQEDEYVETEEHKLYCVEHMDASLETTFKEYDYLTSANPGKRIIASSEYVAGDELYEVNKYGLTKIWDKNQNIAKWGYVGSISHADYPYKLNNSNKVGSIYNKTTDIHNIHPSIETKTNDFFYRIGTFISGTTDGLTYDYKYFKTQSLSIETDSYSENGECVSFDLDLYLKSEFDYFDYFFNNVRFINDDKEYVQTQQFSMIMNSSKYNPCTTLFKGINFDFAEITDIVEDELTGEIKKIMNYGDFDQYKFSIIANFSTSGNTYHQIPVLRRYPDGIKYAGDLGEDTINIFYNKKFKNILIILNLTGIIENTTITHNNLAFYDKRVIYDKNQTIDTNVGLMTARNFISSLNNDNANYYYIDENGESGSTYDNNMMNINSWKKEFSPIQLSVKDINLLSIKKKSFDVAALKGPKTNIYDKFKVDFNQSQYDEDFIKEPLATIVTMNEEELKPRPQYHGETIQYDKKIFRYNGEYEPIFKNVALFAPSNYHVVDGSEFLQKKCGSVFDQDDINNNEWVFPEYALDLCDNTNTFCNFAFTGSAPFLPQESNTLKITDFNFNIPRTALLKGITVSIKKNAEVDVSGMTYSEIFDSGIHLLLNDNNIGYNKADTVNHWLNESTVTEYGDNNDLWDTGLIYEDINDVSFGVSINILTTAITSLVNIAYIDCVCIEIAYTLEGIDNIIYTTSSKRNVKFDTNLYDFGMVDSIIYSKVNETENMLKLKNTKEDKSVYPKIDEFGYQTDKRFIFKSTWDSDYYIKTKNEIE